MPIIDKILTGVFFAAYGVLCIHAIIKKIGAVDMLPIFFAPMLGLLVVSTLQLLIDRPRPYSEKGAGITPLIKKNKDGHSFPSRHIACACVIATTCLPYLMPLGIFLYFLTVLLIYTRFSLGLHYPSDLFAGGILGVLCGLSVFLL
jgi:membrane-associated phospholipid phosphatase